MIGRTVGPYEITATLGRGGMGEVFKARDTKLDREVALKVLPADMAGDAERLARFQREAKVLASLQHQNIAAIYGFETVDGRPVLAMELAQGLDLSERLVKGPLPSDEVARIARQLARGLEYAHEQGIVHRDLKPANVKLAGDGTVKILDFGLARAFNADSVAEGDAVSDHFEATITQALTRSGSVLGTAAYMSPEQARGYEVDRRSDIWSFGVILLEMMTGERLFEGETATDTLAAVLHKEPDWAQLEAGQPPLLVQICRRCLEKEPRQRLRDIGEARVALEGASSSIMTLSASAAVAALPQPRKRGAGLPWAVAAAATVACVAALLAGWSGVLGPKPPPPPVVQASVAVPAGMTPILSASAPGPLQVSPDGRSLCYSVLDSTGQARVVVRNLAEGWTRALSGDGGATYPFWSPDSREVGFMDGNGRLVRAHVNGGPAVQIVDASNVKGGSWNRDDRILYAPTHNSSILMVPATGGEPVDVTHLGRDENVRSHRFPYWLPGGRHFLYIAVMQSDVDPDLDSWLRVGDVETGESRDLMLVQSSVQYAAGHLLYVLDGLLMARPFDPEALAPTGPAVPVLDNVLAIRAAHAAVFSASSTGVLAYLRADTGQDLVDILRISSEGERLGRYVESLLTVGFDFSPDGGTICLAIPDSRTGTMDLWLHEVERGLRTRLTFGTESEWAGRFAPDGTWLAAVNDQLGHSGIYRFSSRGGEAPVPIVVDDNDNTPGGFTADGRLFYQAVDSTATSWVCVVDPATGDMERLHPNAAASEREPRPSPNARWLAYSSDETGSSEIYIEGLGDAQGRWRVSTEGGTMPSWSPDGEQIYYVSGNQSLVAVSVTERGTGIALGTPRVITRAMDGGGWYTYAVDPGSGHLAVIRPSNANAKRSLELVTGWPRLLERSRTGD